MTDDRIERGLRELRGASVITRRPPRIVAIGDEPVAITYDTPPAGVPTRLVPRDQPDTLVIPEPCGASTACSCCAPIGGR